MEKNPPFKSIDEYIAQYPDNIQQILQKIRSVIKEAAPEASEKISYQMPTFYMNGNLVHFAVHTHHVGFYPAPSGIEHFKDDLIDYEYSKGAVKFPLDQLIPYDLIRRITLFRVEENANLAKTKSKQK